MSLPTTEIKAPFVWTTQEGERLTPAEMETQHLFFCVRLIWNHTAPEALQLRPFKRYRGISEWPVEYRRDAVIAICNELCGRELTSWQRSQLEQMAGLARMSFPDEVTNLLKL